MYMALDILLTSESYIDWPPDIIALIVTINALTFLGWLNERNASLSICA